ncbi:MAG: excisionase [Clostridiales bacterium]|nr:excisionase [Clostridiales bacterium]
MHKDIPVAELTLDDATCAIVKIGSVYTPAHLPVGIPVKKGEIDRAALNEWWKNRAIPASRQGIRDALQELKLPSTQNLLDKSFGLSLSDQYWISPSDAALTWKEVNFFENSFSDDVGNILFGKGTGSEKISLISPDNTSDGWLRKKWTIINGKRCLMKGGSGATQQEPYNEVLASAIMRRLDIPHVSYTLAVQDEYPFCVCEDFVTPQTELVSAWYVMQTRKKENHVSVYQHYLNCCDALGIPGARDALDRMMTVDYLIVNEDRHQNNFGVLRNADTLQWLGTAPIYDSGTSLWFESPVSMIQPAALKQPCKPFKTSHSEQIKLVNSFDWVNLSALHGIDEEFREIVKDSPFIDLARCDALCTTLRRRVEMLAEVMREHVKYTAVPDWSSEVQEDVPYSGDEEPER